MVNDRPQALPAEDRLKRPGDATGPSHSTWRTNVALQLQMAGMGEFLVPATGNGGAVMAVAVRNRRQAARASIMMSIDDVMLKEQLMLRFDDTWIIKMMAYIESLHAGDEQASIGAVHSLAMGAGQTLVEFWMVALLAYQRLAATYPLAMQSSTFLSIFITAMLKARPELLALAGDMRADIDARPASTPHSHEELVDALCRRLSTYDTLQAGSSASRGGASTSAADPPPSAPAPQQTNIVPGQYPIITAGHPGWQANCVYVCMDVCMITFLGSYCPLLAGLPPAFMAHTPYGPLLAGSPPPFMAHTYSPLLAASPPAFKAHTSGPA
jgi:hypothetical protein